MIRITASISLSLQKMLLKIHTHTHTHTHTHARARANHKPNIKRNKFVINIYIFKYVSIVSVNREDETDMFI